MDKKQIFFKKMDEIKNSFNRKEYTIHFQKSRNYIGNGRYQETNDAYILYVLLELQKEYDFEIISTNLKGAFATSKIVIRCDKNDKSRIFKPAAGGWGCRSEATKSRWEKQS